MSDRHLHAWRCAACADEFLQPFEVCRSCGADGTLRAVYDLAAVAETLSAASLARREPWMWRYKELLPLDELKELPPLQVGMTPIYGAPRLAAWAGVSGLWLKDEGRNPTGTPVDRAAAIAAVEGTQLGGFERAGCQGVDALAFACFAAAMGFEASLGFAADADPISKARTARFLGTEASRREAPRFDANRTSPVLFEGYATLGLELGEQLCQRMPDWVVVPDVDGRLGEAVERGLSTMRALGFFKDLPRVLAVPLQARRDLEAATDALAALAGHPSGPLGALALAALREAARDATIEPASLVCVVVDGAASGSVSLSSGTGRG